MTIVIVTFFVVGVALERFFRALVLVPACMAVLIVVVIRAAYIVHGLLHATLEFAVLITSLEIGYATTLILAAVPRILQRVSSGYTHAPPAAPSQETVAQRRS